MMRPAALHVLLSAVLALVCVHAHAFAFAGAVVPADAHAQQGFIPHRGQVRDELGRPADDVLYTVSSSGVRIFLRRTGISYVFTRRVSVSGAEHFTTAAPEIIDSVWRMDVTFAGSTGAVSVTAADPVPGDIFLHASGAGALVHAMREVTYHNVYPGIDVVLRMQGQGIKTDFIVHPGADPSRIALAYTGASHLELGSSGALHARVPFGTLDEAAPVSYARSAATAGDAVQTPVASAFVLHGDTVQFAVGARDASRTLVIDPGVLWSTFAGGGDEDWSYGTVVDASGFAYIAGATRSTNFPVAAGMQSSSAGDWDAFVSKYTPAGSLVWSTYLGGSREDFGHGIAISPSGNVTVCGWTASDNFPVSSAWQPARTGLLDAFVTQLSPAGALLWSTYLGGSMDEKCMGVSADGSGNVVITGWTFSTDYPVLGAAQPVLAGYSDLFIAKFSPAGSLAWSTYFGGGADDEAWDVGCDATGNIAVTGRTGSSNFPMRNAQQPLPGGGGSDAYVARFSPAGAPQWSTFIAGGDLDYGRGVAIDAGGYVAVAGYTRSTDLPVLNAWAPYKSQLTDAFVARYSPAGVMQWCTYFGGMGSDAASDVTTDAAGFVYLTGSTGSIDFPLRNAQQAMMTGDEAFAASFSPAGRLSWSTYLGGGNNEGGSGIALAPSSSVMITGTTNSTDFPVLYAQQPVYGGGGWDAFLTKLADCGVPATITVTGPTKICPGGSVTLTANDGTNLDYQWMYRGFTIPGAIDRTYVARDSGTFTVMVSNAIGCVSVSDPVTITMSVPHADPGPWFIICPGGSVQLQGSADGGTPPYTYRWSPASTLVNPDSARPVATPDSATWYKLTVTDSYGCTSTDSLLVRFSIPRVKASGTDTICGGSMTTLHAAPAGGTPPYTFEWLPSEGLVGTGTADPVASPTRTLTYTVTVTDARGCKARDSVTLTVHTLALDVSGSVTICYGDSARLLASPRGGTPPYAFAWGPAISILGADTPSPFVFPGSSTPYEVTVTDAEGCTMRAQLLVTVRSKVQPDITASKPLPLCEGDSVRLDIAAGYQSYRWNTGETTRSIVVKRSGTYSCSVRTADGCRGEGTLAVTFLPYPAPVITVRGSATLCAGDSVVLDAGTGFQTYAWSTGDTVHSIVVGASGTYSVRVANEAGCAGVAAPVRVLVRPRPAPVIIGPDTVCASSDASYSAPVTGGVSYVWSVFGGTLLLGAGTPNVSVRWGAGPVGRITLRMAYDSSGCAATYDLPVSVDAQLAPRITPRGPVRLCEGAQRTLDAGAGYLGYAWSTGATTRTIDVTAPGRYSVRVTRGGTCDGYDSVDVVSVAAPRPRISAARTVLCDADSIVLTLDSAYLSMRWSTGDTLQSIVVRASGDYAASVFDESGCGGVSDTVHVSQAAPPPLRITGDTAVCAGMARTYRMATGPGVRRTFSLAGGTQLMPDIAGDSLAILWNVPGRGVLTVLVTDTTTGCTHEETMFVTVSAAGRLAVQPASVDVQLCAGDTYRLTADSGFTSYIWTRLPSQTDSMRSITVSASGDYTATAVNAAGCLVISDTIRVRVNPRPVARISGSPTACLGVAAVYRTAWTGAERITWQFSGGSPVAQSADSVVVQWTRAGKDTLVVTVTDAVSLCTERDTLVVDAGASLTPRITVTGRQPACEGDSVLLDAGAGFASYLWSSGERTRTLIARSSGTRTVTVSTGGGCTGTSDPILLQFTAPPRPVITGPVVRCAGDTAVLTTTQPYASYRWSTGDTMRSTRVTTEGPFEVTVTDSLGCTGTSSSHLINFLARPPVPVITVRGRVLSTTAAGGLQWRRNGAAIPGAVSDTLVAPDTGRYTVVVRGAGGCTAESLPVEVRDTALGSARIVLPAVTALPGAVVHIPIRLSDVRGFDPRTSGAFTAVLRMHRDLLIPAPGTDAGRISGAERLIDVRTVNVLSDTLADLRFVAALGPVQRTPLTLDSARFGGGADDITTVAGEFSLIVCEEGGARLFDAGGAVTLMQNRPNPFNASTVIDFATIEAGRTTLEVQDALGRRTAVLYDADAEPGRHTVRFDAGGLPSGMYVCILRTPTLLRMMRLALVR